MVDENKIGSCVTVPICFLNHERSKSLISWLSIIIWPLSGSYNRNSNAAKVLLPEKKYDFCLKFLVFTFAGESYKSNFELQFQCRMKVVPKYLLDFLVIVIWRKFDHFIFFPKHIFILDLYSRWYFLQSA